MLPFNPARAERPLIADASSTSRPKHDTRAPDLESAKPPLASVNPRPRRDHLPARAQKFAHIVVPHTLGTMTENSCAAG